VDLVRIGLWNVVDGELESVLDASELATAASASR
jgi:hypothetical protein